MSHSTIPFNQNDMYYVSSDDCTNYLSSSACDARDGPNSKCRKCKASQAASIEFQDAQQKRDRANAQSSDAMKMYSKELITLFNFLLGIAILVYLIYSNRVDIMATVAGNMDKMMGGPSAKVGGSLGAFLRRR